MSTTTNPKTGKRDPKMTFTPFKRDSYFGPNGGCCTIKLDGEMVADLNIRDNEDGTFTASFQAQSGDALIMEGENGSGSMTQGSKMRLLRYAKKNAGWVLIGYHFTYRSIHEARKEARRAKANMEMYQRWYGWAYEDAAPHAPSKKALAEALPKRCLEALKPWVLAQYGEERYQALLDAIEVHG